MQFWSGTAFMKTSEIVPVARMLDEAGFDGMLCSDHMIYPRELSSPYPDSPSAKPPWAPETAWPDCWVQIGAMAAVTERLRFSNAVYVAPARPLLEVAKLVASASVISGGRVSLGGGSRVDARGVRADGSGLHQSRKEARRDDPGIARAVAWRMGVVERGALPGARDDDRTSSTTRRCPSCAAASPMRHCGARCDCAMAGSGMRTAGTRRSPTCRSSPNCGTNTAGTVSRSTSCWRCWNRRRLTCTSGRRTRASPR